MTSYNIMSTQICHKKHPLKWHILLMLCQDSGQTYCTHHFPWCGDGAYVLGLDVLAPHTMVGAKAAGHHGQHWCFQ